MTSNQQTCAQKLTWVLLLICISMPALQAKPIFEPEHTKAMPESAYNTITGAATRADEPEYNQSKPSKTFDLNTLHQESVFTYLDKVQVANWLGQPSELHYIKRSFSHLQKTDNSWASNTNVNPETQLAPPIVSPNLDLLEEFGCSASMQKIFAKNESQIAVNIFQFTTTAGAYGAYCCLRKGASNLVLKGDASSEDEKNVSFWKDRYFVNISQNQSEDEESKSVVRAMAEQLANSMPISSAKPQILMELPTLDRVMGSERMVLGPLALKRLFPAPYIAMLATESMLGAIADYQMQEPYRERLKLLIVHFNNPASATPVFTQYLSKLTEQHDPQEINGVNYQTSVFKIGSTYMLCQIRQDTIVIITGSRKKASLTSLAREVY